jgi:hypothetical protein
MPFLNSVADELTTNEMNKTTGSNASESLTVLSNASFTNTSWEIEPDRLSGGGDFWTVKSLYPMAGVYPLLVACVFLIYFARDWRKQQKKNGGGGGANKDNPAQEEAKPAAGAGGGKGRTPVIELLVVGLLAVLFFLYVGLEVAFGTFLTVFSVKCKLGRYGRSSAEPVEGQWY